MAKASEKLGAQGGNGGSEWDDGVYNGVRKVYIGQDSSRVTYIKFEYDKDGESETREHGIIQKDPKEFVLDYPKEYITSVEGTYNKIRLRGTDVITSLTFKTSDGRVSQTFGYVSGTRFTLEDRGKRLVGLHGRSEDAIDALGAYFAPISSTSYPVYKLDVRGGTGGDAWDDGVYNGVRKVHVGRDLSRITYVKFEYDKAGVLETRDHGKIAQEPKEFALDYPDEYITSVEGTYKPTLVLGPNYVTSLTFTTSKGRSSPTYGTSLGTKFVLEDQGRKLVGFHGREGDALDALGAYFIPVSSPSSTIYQLEAQGSDEGNPWDDDVHDGVRKVYIGGDKSRVSYVKFEYEKGGEVVAREHGKKLEQLIEFALEDPNEYIASVEGTYDKVNLFGSEVVTSLTIKTSTQKTSATFGKASGTSFVLEQKGLKLVGFHGRAGDNLYALGAYFAPIVSATKLEAQGGNGGGSWDDGFYDGVRKIYIGQGELGVSFVKFEYDKGSQTVVGDDHGKKSLLGVEEFELDYPSEYITSMEGFYDKVYGPQSAEVITMLRFKTNKRTSQPFGLEAGTKFTLEKEGCKIVGFHGKASDVVHQVGVHVVPITN